VRPSGHKGGRTRGAFHDTERVSFSSLVEKLLLEGGIETALLSVPDIRRRYDIASFTDDAMPYFTFQLLCGKDGVHGACNFLTRIRQNSVYYGYRNEVYLANTKFSRNFC